MLVFVQIGKKYRDKSTKNFTLSIVLNKDNYIANINNSEVQPFTCHNYIRAILRFPW